MTDSNSASNPAAQAATGPNGPPGDPTAKPKHSLLHIIGPGLLVAATGVGAGDLATGALTGNVVGVAILWAVVLGALMKYVLNEGLARYQLATGNTLLEGAIHTFGRPVMAIFGLYFLLWCFLVGGALMSACGVCVTALTGVGGKVLWGYICSALALALVFVGGFKGIERLMSLCIGLMFVTVVVTVLLMAVNWLAVLTGIFVPNVPDPRLVLDVSAAPADWTPPGWIDSLTWTIALIGGVGGTVTILCYGYWIREEGRGRNVDVESAGGDPDLVEKKARADHALCLIDLRVAYLVTGLFGIAMVIIGNSLPAAPATRPGSKLVVDIANKLATSLPAGVADIAYWAFLIGAVGAVFSSLLGVLQAVPYLAVDLWGHLRRPKTEPTVAADGTRMIAPVEVSTRAPMYRWYMVALATIPSVFMFIPFTQIQKFYAFTGALFMPMLALALLVMNRKRKSEGRGGLVAGWANGRLTTATLGAILLFFTWGVIATLL